VSSEELTDPSPRRIAWWSPLPPQQSGIADYSYDLLAELAGRLDVLAVVADDVVDCVRAPAGVAVVGATAYESGAAGRCDLDVYQMGNHAWLHGYLHARALDHPGLLVLHDPSLADFYAGLCGGADSPLYLEELRYNDPALNGHIPMIRVDGRPEPDRLRLLMVRRLVEQSLMTVVHSAWARDELIRRHPSLRVTHLPHPARTIRLPTSSTRQRPNKAMVFGVFGGLAPHKRALIALEAFARVHQDVPETQIVIVGRGDSPDYVRQLRERITSGSFRDAVRLTTDVSTDVLEQEILGCDVVISLRWPTAGETSGVVMRAFGSGKPVIVSDVPQYRELDSIFCWTVPTEPDDEAKMLESLMRAAAADPATARAAGQAARAFVEGGATYEAVSDGYLGLVSECLQLKAPAPTAVTAAMTDRCAVRAIGDWRAATGLAEAARRSVSALLGAGVPLSIVDFSAVPEVPRSHERAPAWLGGVPVSSASDISLWYLNVNELVFVAEEQLRPPGSLPYVVASWFWELPRLATVFVEQVGRVDEIWVGSCFTADAFRGYTDKPVKVMPCVVEPEPSPRMTRADFGLPERACLFLYAFDANSTLARKNPWDVIRAFRRAFRPEERRGPVRLVIKTINLARLPAAQARLAREVAEAGGLLIEDDVTQAELDALIALCDVYVSLHRSEGFGLGMAEAMYLGRPVIATAYSGNMDFMTQLNSCLVGYRLRPIAVTENREFEGMSSIYETGQLWADPDIDQAARWMRRLYSSPAERRRLGEAAAATIKRDYAASVASGAMITRLQEIAALSRGKIPSALTQ
jgi:glycosyltransferase involved in cell wall biosynthesis